MSYYTVTATGWNSIYVAIGTDKGGEHVHVVMRKNEDKSSMIINDESLYMTDTQTATGSPKTYITKTYTSNSFEPSTEYICRVGEIINKDNTWFDNGQYVTTKAKATRPSNWSWSGYIASGQPVTNLTATDWLGFMHRINDFRRYKDLPNVTVWNPKSGDTLDAWDVNHAIDAISGSTDGEIKGIPGHGACPARVESGDIVYASIFTRLASALNAVQ